MSSCLKIQDQCFSKLTWLISNRGAFRNFRSQSCSHLLFNQAVLGENSVSDNRPSCSGIQCSFSSFNCAFNIANLEILNLNVECSLICQSAHHCLVNGHLLTFQKCEVWSSCRCDKCSEFRSTHAHSEVDARASFFSSEQISCWTLNPHTSRWESQSWNPLDDVKLGYLGLLKLPARAIVEK